MRQVGQSVDVLQPCVGDVGLFQTWDAAQITDDAEANDLMVRSASNTVTEE
jgi:hypothetical protein